MRQAVLAKGAAAHAPTAGAAGKRHFHGAGVFAFQTTCEAKLLRSEGEELTLGLSEEAFAGAIDDTKAGGVVKGEDGQIDFFHYGAQEGSGLHGAETLLAEGFAESVHFQDDFAHGVFTAGAARADGKIFFTQGGEEIGESLQREDHAMLQRSRETEPETDDQESERPGGAGREVARPEKDKGNSRAWEACRQREEPDAAFVSNGAHSRPCFCKRRYMALRLKPRALAAWLTLPSWRLRVRCIRWRSTSSRLISSRRLVFPVGMRRPRSAACTTGPADMSTPRSTAWSSSRTLPGQGCSWSALRAAESKPERFLR